MRKKYHESAKNISSIGLIALLTNYITLDEEGISRIRLNEGLKITTQYETYYPKWSKDTAKTIIYGAKGGDSTKPEDFSSIGSVDTVNIALSTEKLVLGKILLKKYEDISVDVDSPFEEKKKFIESLLEDKNFLQSLSRVPCYNNIKLTKAEKHAINMEYLPMSRYMDNLVEEEVKQLKYK